MNPSVLLLSALLALSVQTSLHDVIHWFFFFLYCSAGPLIYQSDAAVDLNIRINAQTWEAAMSGGWLQLNVQEAKPQMLMWWQLWVHSVTLQCTTAYGSSNTTALPFFPIPKTQSFKTFLCLYIQSLAISPHPLHSLRFFQVSVRNCIAFYWDFM